jgi:hypothetical protein
VLCLACQVSLFVASSCKVPGLKMTDGLSLPVNATKYATS